MTSTIRILILNRIISTCPQTNTSSRRCRPIRMRQWIFSLRMTQHQLPMSYLRKSISMTLKRFRRFTKIIRTNCFKRSSSFNTILLRNRCNNSGLWPMYICLKSTKSSVTVSTFEVLQRESEIFVPCGSIPLRWFRQFERPAPGFVRTIGQMCTGKNVSVLKIRSPLGNFNVCAHCRAFSTSCVRSTWNSIKPSSTVTFRMFFHLSHKASLCVIFAFATHSSDSSSRKPFAP